MPVTVRLSGLNYNVSCPSLRVSAPSHVLSPLVPLLQEPLSENHLTDGFHLRFDSHRPTVKPWLKPLPWIIRSAWTSTSRTTPPLSSDMYTAAVKAPHHWSVPRARNSTTQHSSTSPSYSPATTSPPKPGPATCKDKKSASHSETPSTAIHAGPSDTAPVVTPAFNYTASSTEPKPPSKPQTTPTSAASNS